jgi:hypothetical protein
VADPRNTIISVKQDRLTDWQKPSPESEVSEGLKGRAVRRGMELQRGSSFVGSIVQELGFSLAPTVV